MTKKVLLVDDDQESCDMLKTRIESKGYEVIVAHNGQEGLDLVASGQPDLILADLIMPVLDGFTMIKQLKRDGCKTPIIVITAREQMKDLCEVEGVLDYMTKPFDTEDLMTRIKWNLHDIEEKAGESPASTVNPPPAKRKLILIVDDDLSLSEALSIRLQSEGFETKVVNDGEQAMEVIRDVHPSFIMLDVMMPKLDGYSTLREINRLTERKVPVMIMTGTKTIDEEEFRLEGACAFVRKPFDGAEVAKQIKEILTDV